MTHSTPSKQTNDAIPVVLDARVVTGTGGGPDKTILNSPRFFAPLGYRMLCAYMHPPGDPGYEQLVNKAGALAAPLLSVADRGPWDWKVVTRLLDICRRERVRIWHGHDYKSNVLGLLLRRFWPMRLVTTVHGWVKQTRRTPLYYTIDRLCLPRYEAVICVSEDLHQRCRSSGVPAERCVLVENGIDTEQFVRTRSTAQAKAQLGLDPRRRLIGAVGRLSPEKGFDYLLRAVLRLQEEGQGTELVIVGEGSEEAYLKNLASELGIRDRVHFLGYRADPRPVFEAMDVFALSSLREGLPNVVLEAAAMRVPIVATRIAGIPRVIDDRQTGLVVEPGSAEMLADGLAEVLNNEALRERVTREARRLIENRYSFACRIRKLASLYDSLLSSGEIQSCTSDADPVPFAV